MVRIRGLEEAKIRNGHDRQSLSKCRVNDQGCAMGIDDGRGVINGAMLSVEETDQGRRVELSQMNR